MPDFLFSCYDTKNLLSAVTYSLNYMTRPSSRQFYPYADITHDRVVASLEALGDMLDSGLVGRDLNTAIRHKFDVYESVGCDDRGTVLFTGYYTPIFNGSLKKTARFKYPLYSQPKDIVKGPAGEILGKQNPDGSLTPYPTRQILETSGVLNGKEIVYLEDPFEVYIAHVQGSAKIRMPDKELITAGYAASNGHEYSSVAKRMLKDDVFAGRQMSLAAMIDFFKNNPDKVDKYIQSNPRFVFFQMGQTEPRGSINTPVTAYRTIATDKSVYPRAALSFISTTLPTLKDGQIIQRKYTGFTLDQDTGGAIRAPGRCDVYMGVGDKAGKIAGSVYQEGRLYYLFIKR